MQLHFLLIILIIVVSVALIFPKNGVALGEKVILKFHWSLNSFSNSDVQYADITKIINENQSIILEDTLLLIDIEKGIDTVKASAAELNARVHFIEYPAGDLNILNSFFQKLDNSDKSRVRILHYGDSQIEGDRITGYLRNRFQRRFGGSGPGLLPAIPSHAESASIQHFASRNWQAHSVYYKKDTILPHRRFGVLGSFGRFTNYKEDSIVTDSSIKTATIEFKRSGMAYSSVNNFNQCRIFYGHCNEKFVVKGFVNDSLIWFQEMDTTQNTQNFQWNFTSTPTDFRVEFESTKSPDIYGISLETKVGVAVDNLPFRGSSGTEFTKLEYNQLKQMANFLKSGLVIMEFGVNVVPHHIKSYSYYERALTRQLKYLKYVFPKTPILVIGLSDMSKRTGNYYESHPNIEKINLAQRNAAKNANCAFWDLYSAMGGKNSMPSWVFAEPPLARKDFTHFNRKGGHIVAQMLYNALMHDYESYKADKKNVAVNTN
ncbi:MAG: hypothetical protein DRJ10_18035 [Bacteroidetes bacterium]|nr:MAG: hypothetical protein DRJ10_18035 [Bacteroidota bacterium]